MKRTVVLVHGAWHRGSCWKDVQEILEKEGHTVYALTYPGNSEGDSTDVTSEDYLAWLPSELEKIPGKVTVIGHSSAGIIMSGSLYRIPEKIELAIFNNAFIPPDGRSQFDCIEDEVQTAFRAVAGQREDNCVPMDPEFMRGKLMQLCDQELFDRVMAEEIVPQPLAIFETKAETQKFINSGIPCAMVHCTDDVSVPENFYRTMFESIGRGMIVEIPGEHEALISSPHVLADAILKIFAGTE